MIVPAAVLVAALSAFRGSACVVSHHAESRVEQRVEQLIEQRLDDGCVGSIAVANDTLPRQRAMPTLDASRFDSVTAMALREVLDSAVARGIPTTPLVNKALEGAAKHANGMIIVKTVRAHAQAMIEARDVLGAESSVDELNSGADALRAGIDARLLATVRIHRAPGTGVTALVVLTDIVKRGVPTLAARDAVSSIARMPRSDDALLGLQATVAKNSIRGPGMAVEALNRYVRGTTFGSSTPPAPATVDRKTIRPPSP